MKKSTFIWALGVLCVMALGLASCQKELASCQKEEEFDETLLIGKWKSGTLYEKYLSDHTGFTWDTKEDVSESEAQSFTWKLEKSTLTQIHIMEVGGNVPKVYTVTKLTSTTLSYEDDYGKSYTFTKVN